MLLFFLQLGTFNESVMTSSEFKTFATGRMKLSEFSRFNPWPLHPEVTSGQSTNRTLLQNKNIINYGLRRDPANGNYFFFSWAACRDADLLTLRAVCGYITFWWEWQIDCYSSAKAFSKHEGGTAQALLWPQLYHVWKVDLNIANVSMDFELFLSMWSVRVCAVGVPGKYLAPPHWDLIEFIWCILGIFETTFSCRHPVFKWVH